MSDKLRIFHILRSPVDDLREHVNGLAAGLAARKAEPHVVGDLGRHFRQELSRQGIRWVNLPLPSSGSAKDIKAGVETLSRLLGGSRPQIVHAHGGQAGVMAARALARIDSQSRLICSVHGLPSFAGLSFLDRRARRGEYSRMLARADALIASSQSEADALLAMAGPAHNAIASKLHIVPPGVQRRRASGVFDLGEKRHSVGLHRDAAIVAVMPPPDGDGYLEDFFRAAAVVGRNMPNVEFAVLGEVPREDELKQLVHSVGLTGNTVFVGGRPDTMDVMGTANVFVALSDKANGITNALEALARNLRVVAVDLPGLREVFGDCGSIPLIDSEDPEALASAIERQLEGMSSEEDEVRDSHGMAWGVSEVLASQDEYDLDKPGLDPRDQTEEEDSDVERLLSRYSVDNMLNRTLEVYNRVLAAE